MTSVTQANIEARGLILFTNWNELNFQRVLKDITTVSEVPQILMEDSSLSLVREKIV
jgi:hypothetical protein